MKIIVLFVFILLPFISLAQDIEDSEVPKQVMDKFKKSNTMNDEVDWKKKGDNYIAELDINEKEINITYDSKGNMVQKEVELEESEIPKPTMRYFNSKYLIKKEGDKLSNSEMTKKVILESLDAYKITDSQGNITYKIDAITSDLLFDSKGNFLKEVEKVNIEE
jgi:hypothetical protein